MATDEDLGVDQQEAPTRTGPRAPLGSTQRRIPSAGHSQYATTRRVNVNISQLTDIEEIRDLTFRYSEGWDFKDWDVLLDVFTEDAVWDPSALGMPKAKGMEELRPLFDGFCQTMVGGSQHIQGNLRVQFLDPDNATGRCYVIGQTRNASGGDTEVMGFYEDVYRRVDGRWKLASRVTKPFMSPTMGGLV